MCWVREEVQKWEALHHGRLLVSAAPKPHTFLSNLTPVSPRLVFHPCPSGCNKVPGCGWMDGEAAAATCSPNLGRNNKAHGGNEPPIRCILITPVSFVQFLTIPVSFLFPVPFNSFCPFLPALTHSLHASWCCLL